MLVVSGRWVKIEARGLGGVGMGQGGFQKSGSCRDNGGLPSLNPAVGTVLSAAQIFVMLVRLVLFHRFKE